MKQPPLTFLCLWLLFLDVSVEEVKSLIVLRVFPSLLLLETLKLSLNPRAAWCPGGLVAIPLSSKISDFVQAWINIQMGHNECWGWEEGKSLK